MNKTLILLLVLVFRQTLFAGDIISGITAGSEYFLSRHGDYFNPSVGAGYRARLGLGESKKWQLGGDINAGYFINREGVDGLFMGMPLKVSVARKFAIGSFNIIPGFAAGLYFSLLRDGANDYTGLSTDIILASPYLEIGPTLSNGSGILLITACDILAETGESKMDSPVFMNIKIGYVF